MGRLLIVTAAAAALALATTSGASHVSASAPLLVIAAALVTGVLVAPERAGRTLAIAAAMGAGLLAEHVLFRPGLPQVHDTDHVWGLWAYARAVRSGHPLPMWMPWLGAGMPLLQFYGPVGLLLALPAILAGAAPVAVWKYALAQTSVLAALGALAGARVLGASWRGAAIAACALAFAPWKLAVVHVRGALGEATALAWAPLVAAAGLAMLAGPSRRAPWMLGLAVALLIPTHLITLLGLAVVLVPAAIAAEAAGRGDGDRPPLRRRLACAALPVVLAAGCLSVWWVPAIAEGGRTSLSIQTRENPYFEYAQHGLFASDLFARRGWDKPRASLRRVDRAQGREGEQMPFYVGAALLLLGVTAPWWSRSRATWGLACGAAVSVMLATAPAADLATHLPLLPTLQFPWRFLSIASVFAALAIGVGAGALSARSARGWRGALPVLILPGLLVFDAAPYAGAAGWVPPFRGVTHWVPVEGRDPSDPYDRAWRAVPQGVDDSGPMIRVGDLYLPPDTTDTPVELAWLPYVEWTTPAYYRGLLATRAPEEFGEAAVRWFFVPERDGPIPIPAKPYATLVGSDGETDAGAYERAPGRIALRPRAPEGGARLIVREMDFPGWVARVDGREVPTGAGPLGFIALDLPAGEHTVDLTYTRRTPARRAGLWASLAALGVTIVVARKRGVSPFRWWSRRG